MLLAQHLAEHDERLLEEGPCAGEIAALLQHDREIMQIVRDLRMIRAQRRAVDGDRAAIQLLRRREVAAPLQDLRQLVHRRGGGRALLAGQLGEQGEAAPQRRLGGRQIPFHFLQLAQILQGLGDLRLVAAVQPLVHRQRIAVVGLRLLEPAIGQL